MCELANVHTWGWYEYELSDCLRGSERPARLKRHSCEKLSDSEALFISSNGLVYVHPHVHTCI